MVNGLLRRRRCENYGVVVKMVMMVVMLQRVLVEVMMMGINMGNVVDLNEQLVVGVISVNTFVIA